MANTLRSRSPVSKNDLEKKLISDDESKKWQSKKKAMSFVEYNFDYRKAFKGIIALGFLMVMSLAIKDHYISLFLQFEPLVEIAVTKNTTEPSTEPQVFPPLAERRICHEKCCVTERQRHPQVTDYNFHRHPPTFKDRVGIYEFLEYLPEVRYWRDGERESKRWHHNVTLLTPDVIPCLQPGTIVVSKSANAKYFFEEIYPLLQNPIVLITMNGDQSAPERLISYVHDEGRRDGKILHWYAANCAVPSNKYPKLTCIPIGFALFKTQKVIINDFLRDLPGLTYEQNGRPMFPQEIEQNRTGLVMVNFNIYNRTKVSYVHKKTLLVKRRADLWKHMCQNDDTNFWPANSVLCANNFDEVQDMYTTAIRYKFMVSPHGIGWDCHRTWEALFLGMIPVVKTSFLDEMYEGLPVLIVDEWSDITPELLHRTYDVFSRQKFNFERLYIKYWQLQASQYRANPNIYYEYSIPGKNATKIGDYEEDKHTDEANSSTEKSEKRERRR